MARLRFRLRAALRLSLIPFAVAAHVYVDSIDRLGWWNEASFVPILLLPVTLRGIGKAETLSAVEDMIEQVADERSASFVVSGVNSIAVGIVLPFAAMIGIVIGVASYW
jgi:hypothetical protein